MENTFIPALTICGIHELPSQQTRGVTHVLSLLDPDWPTIEAFQRYDEHHRETLCFHDVIDPAEGKLPPTPALVEEILRFGAGLEASRADRKEGHLLVHCHMGVSRSTAAMLALLAQAFPRASEDRLFEHLRQIRPQAWPNSLMIEYADDLLGRGGRLMTALCEHYGHQLKRDPGFRDWMTQLGRGREVEMAVT
ncbi:MAG: protein-tyrosine-phosphatase [Rhodospirillales bacterium]|nr:protein-tyrosine-phosphatase [Rhodospirillales bacterium]